MTTDFEVVVRFRGVLGFDAGNADVIRVVSKLIEERLDAEILSVEIVKVGNEILVKKPPVRLDDWKQVTIGGNE